MAEQDIKPIKSNTGVLPVPRIPVEAVANNGKVEPETGKAVPPPPEEAAPDLEELTKQLNTVNQTIGRDLRFQIDLKSGRSVIQVLDRDTGEIVRSIPPEDAKTYVSEAGVELRLFDEQV